MSYNSVLIVTVTFMNKINGDDNDGGDDDDDDDDDDADDDDIHDTV